MYFGGVHAAAQRVGHLPELGLVADVGRRRASGRSFLSLLSHHEDAGFFRDAGSPVNDVSAVAQLAAKTVTRPEPSSSYA